jgi:hypothetical protein
MAGLGETEWREHAELIGQVTLGWNQTVFQVLRIFVHLTGIGSPLADALFFSHQSDRGQRNLVKKVAETVGLADEDMKKLKALMDRLDKIAIQRNLATHTIFGLSMFDPKTEQWGPTVVPALSPNPDKRLNEDFTKQFRDLERDLGTICRDLEDWFVHTQFPKRDWGMPTFVGNIPGQTPVPSGPQLDVPDADAGSF